MPDKSICTRTSAVGRSFSPSIEPYREDLVVAAELHFHLLLARRSLCPRKNPVILGHALYMKAIHGGKARKDQIDVGFEADARVCGMCQPTTTKLVSNRSPIETTSCWKTSTLRELNQCLCCSLGGAVGLSTLNTSSRLARSAGDSPNSTPEPAATSMAKPDDCQSNSTRNYLRVGDGAKNPI